MVGVAVDDLRFEPLEKPGAVHGLDLATDGGAAGNRPVKCPAQSTMHMVSGGVVTDSIGRSIGIRHKDSIPGKVVVVRLYDAEEFRRFTVEVADQNVVRIFQFEVAGYPVNEPFGLGRSVGVVDEDVGPAKTHDLAFGMGSKRITTPKMEIEAEDGVVVVDGFFVQLDGGTIPHDAAIAQLRRRATAPSRNGSGLGDVVVPIADVTGDFA